MLAALDIRSATTCEIGLAHRATPRYALPRILDSSRVSQIEFEAEMCGFGELARGLKALVRRRYATIEEGTG